MSARRVATLAACAGSPVLGALDRRAGGDVEQGRQLGGVEALGLGGGEEVGIRQRRGLELGPLHAAHLDPVGTARAVGHRRVGVEHGDDDLFADVRLDPLARPADLVHRLGRRDAAKIRGLGRKGERTVGVGEGAAVEVVARADAGDETRQVAVLDGDEHVSLAAGRAGGDRRRLVIQAHRVLGVALLAHTGELGVRGRAAEEVVARDLAAVWPGYSSFRLSMSTFPGIWKLLRWAWRTKCLGSRTW